MSITYSISRLSTSVEDVSVEVPVKADMTLQATDTKDGVTETNYVVATGDNAYQSYVTFRSEIQNRKGVLIRRISVTFSTWAVQSDSVAGTDTMKPVNGTIAFNLPADMTIEVADLDDFLGNLVSYCYPSVTTKVRSTAWLQKLLYGVTQVA